MKPRQANLYYVAGVLDTVGRFSIGTVNGVIRHATVSATLDSRAVGEALTETLGGTMLYDRWTLPADQQAEALSTVIPFMRNLVQIERARAVIAFRMTSARRVGHKPSGAVKEWRQVAFDRAKLARIRDKNGVDVGPGKS